MDARAGDASEIIENDGLKSVHPETREEFEKKAEQYTANDGETEINHFLKKQFQRKIAAKFSKMSNQDFPKFLEKFPPVEMPITLGEDDHHTFSTENEPLSEALVEQFIFPFEKTPADEFTEYVPCFSIAGTEKFHALIYWKASLLTYEYILATFLPDGRAINRRVIAKTLVREDKIHRSVATIDEDLIILVAQSAANAADDSFDPEATRTFNFEILANGEIIEYNAAMN